VVYILKLLQLVAAVVEVPLGQTPGGDRNNQNCTAEEKLWCLATTSEVAKKMCAFSAAPVAETVPELLWCHLAVRRLDLAANYCSSSVL